MVCHHPTKFGDHRYCPIRDMFLVCQVVSQYHMIKASCDYLWEPLKVGHHPAKFGGHRQCVGGYIIVLVYDVILQDHVIKGSCDFGWKTLTVSHHPTKFDGHR